jgi:hypothetical protein
MRVNKQELEPAPQVETCKLDVGNGKFIRFHLVNGECESPPICCQDDTEMYNESFSGLTEDIWVCGVCGLRVQWLNWARGGPLQEHVERLM